MPRKTLKERRERDAAREAEENFGFECYKIAESKNLVFLIFCF